MNSYNVKDNIPFDIEAILTSGQVFRYEYIDNEWIVYSRDKKAIIKDRTIYSDDIDYFINYFDLNRDYNLIMDTLHSKPMIEEGLKIGSGIRILNQDKFEMVISFIISTQNFIPRIKKIIEKLCTALGERKEGYYAFPTPSIMAEQTVEFYESIGAGYRAKYLLNSAKAIAEGKIDLDSLSSLTTEDISKQLLQLQGVGQKVADCILLFAYHREDTFPVDTWIKKAYFNLKGENAPDKQIRKELIELYSPYPGTAQQYIFYGIRNREKKKD